MAIADIDYMEEPPLVVAILTAISYNYVKFAVFNSLILRRYGPKNKDMDRYKLNLHPFEKYFHKFVSVTSS